MKTSHLDNWSAPLIGQLLLRCESSAGLDPPAARSASTSGRTPEGQEDLMFVLFLKSEMFRWEAVLSQQLCPLVSCFRSDYNQREDFLVFVMRCLKTRTVLTGRRRAASTCSAEGWGVQISWGSGASFTTSKKETPESATKPGKTKRAGFSTNNQTPS